MIDWIVWVAVGLGLLIMEMLLPGVFMMWLGLAAIGAGLLTFGFGFQFAAQVISFGILTVISLAIGLRLRRPLLEVMHTEKDGLVGRRATALVFEGRDGRVRLGDTDWAARVPPDLDPPDPGARMKVERVDGTTLIVRPDL
ncbi:MAG: NfeD family protein [Acetobacteraceae bacterium]|nr:NfeD family protein [Acetobacteraceae bacterium]